MKHDNEMFRIEQRKTAAVIARTWGVPHLVEGEEFAFIDYTAQRTPDGPTVCAIEIKNLSKKYPRQMVDLHKARAVLDWDVKHNRPAFIVWRWPERGGWDIRWARPRDWDWCWITKRPVDLRLSYFKRNDRANDPDDPTDLVVWIPNELLRPLSVNPFVNERE